MNDKQLEILSKEFKVNEHFSITRGDYESMPDPLIAWNWTDEEMQAIADKVAKQLVPYDPTNEEDCESDFWTTMENVAVGLGMEFYEDYTEEELAELNKEWNKIK